MTSSRCTIRCVSSYRKQPVCHLLGPGALYSLHLDAESLQAKNVVFNVSEMEAKVREATNEDPWCVRAPWEHGEYAESVGDFLGVQVPR